MNTNTQEMQGLPVPEPREVIGLTASFSGITALLVLATLAPHPVVPATPAATAPISAEQRVAGVEVGRHAVGV
jgi:hypothetical protein